MVVLAVDIVGNCSTKRYIFCSRRYGEEKSAGDGKIEDLGERDAGFGGEKAGLGVEVDQAVHSGCQ